MSATPGKATLPAHQELPEMLNVGHGMPFVKITREWKKKRDEVGSQDGRGGCCGPHRKHPPWIREHVQRVELWLRRVQLRDVRRPERLVVQPMPVVRARSDVLQRGGIISTDSLAYPVLNNIAAVYSSQLVSTAAIVGTRGVTLCLGATTMLSSTGSCGRLRSLRSKDAHRCHLASMSAKG